MVIEDEEPSFISFPMRVLQGRDLGLRLFGGFGWYHAPLRARRVSACAHADTSGSSSQVCPSGPQLPLST